MKGSSGLSYMTRNDINASDTQPVGDLPKIFISYKKHEKKQMSDQGLIYTRDLAARKIISLCDCAVWHDGFLTAGGDYNSEISAAIKECDAVILLLTANVLESNYIWKTEIRLAQENGKTIIPIAFDFPQTSYSVIESRLGRMLHVINWPGGDDDSVHSESEFNESLARALEILSETTTLTQEITKIAPILDEGYSLTDVSLRSLYLIGRASLDGIRVEKDIAKGRNLLDVIVKMDCMDSNVVALRCLAANALFSHYNELNLRNPEQSDYAPCREYAKIGVELGDAELTYRRGYMYRKGRGAGRDLVQAAQLFERAVQLGSVKAMCALGVMRRNGEGVPRDPEGAFELLSAAATQGSGEAMWNIAQMYEMGEGTAPNEALAEEWHIKAADINGGYAMRKLGEKYEKEGNFAAAYKWYHNSAMQDDAIAMRKLGDMYRKGSLAEKNLGSAFDWYYKSAAVGNFVAMRNLGLMYMAGQSVDADAKKAFEWFSRSVELGGMRAAGSLGRMFYLGEDLPQDLSMSAYWYKIAADKGSEPAAAALAQLLENGVEIADPEKLFAQREVLQETEALGVEETAEYIPEEQPEAAEPVSEVPLTRKEAKAAFKAQKAESKRLKKEEKAALKQAAKEAKKSRGK